MELFGASANPLDEGPPLHHQSTTELSFGATMSFPAGATDHCAVPLTSTQLATSIISGSVAAAPVILS